MTSKRPTGCAEKSIRSLLKTAPQTMAARIHAPACATTPVPAMRVSTMAEVVASVTELTNNEVVVQRLVLLSSITWAAEQGRLLAVAPRPCCVGMSSMKRSKKCSEETL